MRVNARLDEDSQQQLDYLTHTTGQSVSHVVREAVALYHAKVRSRQGVPKRLLASVGTGDSGRTDVASNVKQHVSDALDAKFPHTRR